MNNQTFSQLLSEMPALHHTLPGMPFDMDKSEVVNWLMSQPGVKQYLFQKAKDSGRIVYDPETGTWRGVTPVRGRGRPRKAVPVMEVES